MRWVYQDATRRDNCSRLGFTFVELMIVVTLLGILAMMVIPQVTLAIDDAREAALTTDLMTIRKQVELYKAQHFGRGPQYNEKGDLEPPVIIARMTQRTDPDGRFNNAGKCGPYLKVWPKNPFCNPPNNWLTYGTNPAPLRTGTPGWYLCYTTGIISANSKTGAQKYDPPATP